MKKIKEDKNWKYYSNIIPRKGYKAIEIKRGKHKKNYWEYKLKTPKGKIKRIQTNANNFNHFKQNVKDKAYKKI